MKREREFVERRLTMGEGVRMKDYRIAQSSVIHAPAKSVYDILADYQNGHPHILPKKYFTSLKIEQGGIGAGTVIQFQMGFLGYSQPFRAAITELLPGRTLVETDLESGAVTTFTVLQLENGQVSLVTISTELRSRDGLLGYLEQTMVSSFLRRVYSQELKLLAKVVDGRVSSPTNGAHRNVAAVRNASEAGM
jgi:hypothetical protein